MDNQNKDNKTPVTNTDMQKIPTITAAMEVSSFGIAQDAVNSGNYTPQSVGLCYESDNE